jgi:hypothetical protein
MTTGRDGHQFDDGDTKPKRPEKDSAVNDLRTYSTREVAEEYGLKECYLRKLRQLSKGPRYSKLGRMIRYRKDDVEIWLRRAMIEITPKGIV